MRKSNARGSGKGDVSLTNTTGEHAGDSIALDHILPIAVVPELAARFFNLEAIPAHQNQAKSARIGRREVALARHWHREGLLSAAGLQAVETAEEMNDLCFLVKLTEATRLSGRRHGKGVWKNSLDACWVLRIMSINLA